MDLKGWLLQHSQLGLCKVLRHDNRTAEVQFVNGNRQYFRLTSFQDGTLKRAKLPRGSRCSTSTGDCTVIEWIARARDVVWEYQVQHDGTGRTGVASEKDLKPLDESVAESVLDFLAQGKVGSSSLFAAREELAREYARTLRQAGGLKALLSSRLDLRAHQAFVAGVVLQDPRRRYILADEVGLGKTIEAGVVIHDLLQQKPGARILILCPGSLGAQWLSELYSKFGGHIFKMLDLAKAAPQASDVRLAILSMARAAGRSGTFVSGIPWDLVVVDEAHQLLDWPTLYEIVKGITEKAPSVLLLSAVPARRREDEYLRLLTLLEPKLYALQRIRQGFGELYAAQRAIGAGLKVLARRVEGVEAGSVSPDEVLSACDRLVEYPVLREDAALRAMAESARREPKDAAEVGAALCREVADKYRVHRRILRNRRERLIEEGRLERVERKYQPLSYEPEPHEVEALRAAHRLLLKAKEAGLEEGLLLPFTRALFQAAADPAGLGSISEILSRVDPIRLNEKGKDYVTQGLIIGPEDWPDYLKLLCAAARPKLDNDAILELCEAASSWRSVRTPSRRMAVRDYLRARQGELGDGAKFLVFAGYPGVAEQLALYLRKAFKHEDAVAEFCAAMGAEEKEEAVARFRMNPKTWLLVSDESGGEGRNFQFASELIHFDNPWNIARIEQRVGRLDRLGREEFSHEVTSVVVHARGTSEEGLVTVARDGIGIYTKSISGLEFGLRQMDDQLARAACEEEPLAALQEFVPAIRDAATSERARDDADAVLDEASYERKAATRYLRVATPDDSGQALEVAFTRYFEHLAPKGVSKYRDDAGHALLCFDTHKANGDALALPQQAATGDGRFRGAFDRKVAQVTPGQQFFQVGNPLFDAVMESARNRPNGRTYAVECTVPKLGAWRGFEYIFRPTVNAAGLANAWAFAQRATSALDAVPVHVFVSADGTVGPEGLLEIRLGLAKRRKHLEWNDLSERPNGAFLNAVGGPWPQVVRACHQVAAQVGRKILEDRVEPAIGVELAYLMDLERGAKPGKDPEADDLLDKVKRYRSALLDWEMVLDGVGFLSVNAPL